MAPLADHLKDAWRYGSSEPYAEPTWARGSPSPYIKPSHRRLRHAMRMWVEQNIIPHQSDWEAADALPNQIYRLAGENGILMPMAAGKKIGAELAGKYPIMGGVRSEEWDGFHDYIIHDELMRVGGVGIPNGLIGGVTLAIPAILKYGSEELRQRIVPEVLSGHKRICLAITEPSAGSDVQSMTTEAKLSDDGSHYIVNGQKKWITTGMYADYFLTLTRTSATDLSLMVIPRGEGLTTRHMVMAGSACAGTAFVDLDDVKVPRENLVGRGGDGLKFIMSNFNHEISFPTSSTTSNADQLSQAIYKLPITAPCTDLSRGHDRMFSFLKTREAFGRKLLDQPVIRFRLAHMARETEALQAWIESLIYQLDSMERSDAESLLAGQTAQVKAHSGIVLENVTSAAVQLMGGLGLTRGGRGERVERIWRDIKAITIPGGSQDVLLEWSVRRALLAQKALWDTEKTSSKL